MLTNATVQINFGNGQASPVLLSIDACADAVLSFEFVTKQPRPRNFAYCNLTAVDLCLPVNEPTPRQLASVRFLASESACIHPLIDLAAPEAIDFLVDQDAPTDVYGVRVRIPAHATCCGKERHRETSFTLQAIDSNGLCLVLANGLLAIQAK